MRRQLISDISRTRVQHQPDHVLRIDTNFDEMVSAAECAELFTSLAETLLHVFMQGRELGPAVPVFPFRRGIAMLFETDGDNALDLATKVLYILVKDPASNRSFLSHHSVS